MTAVALILVAMIGALLFGGFLAVVGLIIAVGGRSRVAKYVGVTVGSAGALLFLAPVVVVAGLAGVMLRDHLKHQATRGPLIAAIHDGDEQAVVELIEDGHPLDVDDSVARQWGTPLAAAAGHGQARIVETLLARGAKVDFPYGDDKTALSALIESYGCGGLGTDCSRAEVVALLLDAGASPDTRAGRAQDSLFHRAMRSADEELLRLLLERGLDPKVTNGAGQTALFAVSWHITKDDEVLARCKAVGDRLLRGGVDINARDDRGRTALEQWDRHPSGGDMAAWFRARGGKTGAELDQESP